MDSLHEANSESVPKDGDNGSREIRVSVVGGASAFEVVEKATCGDGTWSDTQGTEQTLTINGSDVSGMLRFMRRPRDQENPECFSVVLGYDTDKWCDLKVDLPATDTGALILQRYYDASTHEYSIKQRHQTTVTGWSHSRTKITVTITDEVIVLTFE
jgi:hypothetical protein